MDPYMLIYRTKEHWPVTGDEISQKVYFFPTADAAKGYKDFLISISPGTLTDVQLYEYTGIQYVLVERWHKDD